MDMKNWTIDEIKSFGFKGFFPIAELRKNLLSIPDERGVYLILSSGKEFVFLNNGTGGYFKKKNPNVDLSTLKNKWIENTVILYIGQAGGIRNGKWSNSTLRMRLKKYFDFGIGKPVGHYGGRYIWQLEKSSELIVCWKELPNKIADPSEIESNLINSFKSKYKNRPFANLKE